MMEKYLPVLILVLFAPTWLTLAEERERPNRIEVSVVKDVTGKKGLTEGLPAGRLFADAQAFEAWWSESELDENDRPEVDFEKVFISVETRDAADPNRVRWGARLSEDSQAEVMGMSTRIGYEPSNRVTLSFLAVVREGVKGLVRWESFVNEDGKRVQTKRVYPLINEEDTDLDK